MIAMTAFLSCLQRATLSLALILGLCSGAEAGEAGNAHGREPSAPELAVTLCARGVPAFAFEGSDGAPILIAFDRRMRMAVVELREYTSAEAAQSSTLGSEFAQLFIKVHLAHADAPLVSAPIREGRMAGFVATRFSEEAGPLAARIAGAISDDQTRYGNVVPEDFAKAVNAGIACLKVLREVLADKQLQSDPNKTRQRLAILAAQWEDASRVITAHVATHKLEYSETDFAVLFKVLGTLRELSPP